LFSPLSPKGNTAIAASHQENILIEGGRISGDGGAYADSSLSGQNLSTSLHNAAAGSSGGVQGQGQALSNPHQQSVSRLQKP